MFVLRWHAFDTRPRRRHVNRLTDQTVDMTHNIFNIIQCRFVIRLLVSNIVDDAIGHIVFFGD